MIKDMGRALLRLYPMGISMLWKAPLILALAAIPEFIQHIAEIQLGMFDNLKSFRTFAFDPLRLALGGIKMVGLVLSTFAAARFWWTRRSGPTWHDLRSVAWKRFLAGFVLFMVVPGIPLLGRPITGELVAYWASIALTIAMLPGLIMMIGGLLGDDRPPVREYWLSSWPWAVLAMILCALAFVPLQRLHELDHQWANRSEPLTLWSLMAWDAVVVGLMGGLIGTALYLAYAGFARHRAS